MMDIVKEALAGTLESSDLMVRVGPGPDQTLDLVINSAVRRQFGRRIEQVVRESLDKLGVRRGVIIVEDKGALDCTIRARVQAAVLRGANRPDIDWNAVS